MVGQRAQPFERPETAYPSRSRAMPGKIGLRESEHSVLAAGTIQNAPERWYHYRTIPSELGRSERGCRRSVTAVGARLTTVGQANPRRSVDLRGKQPLNLPIPDPCVPPRQALKLKLLPVPQRTSFSGITFRARSTKFWPLQCIGMTCSMSNLFSPAITVCR